MFAVVKIGPNQHKVSIGDIVITQKIDASVDTKITLDEVILVGDAEKTIVFNGIPSTGTFITAQVMEQTASPKVNIFKKKRRKHQQKKLTHSQPLTVLHILDIQCSVKS